MAQRTTKASVRKTAVADVEAKTTEQTAVAEGQDTTTTTAITPKEIDASQYVIVRNGFQGRLVYKSRKTGETYVWDSFGSEQEMELRELRNAKSSFKKYFIDNWFMFDKDEDWIIDYLGVRQYYKHALPLDKFDEIFDLKPAELKAKIALLSDGQKRSVSYRAKELIADNKIDSRSVISALEEALGVELIEK